MVRIDEKIYCDSSSGYAAVRARLARNAITLASWLTGGDETGSGRQPPTVDQASKVAETLFGEQLTAMFEEALRTTVPIRQWLAPSPVLRLRSEHALATYGEVWHHERGANRRDAVELSALISSYLTSGYLPLSEPGQADEETTYVHGFGDLHSTNVLIMHGASPRPVLVDASLYRSYHWAGDAARLLVDLVIRVRRSRAAAQLWEEFDEDCQHAYGLCPIYRSSDPRWDNDETQAVDAFITHVVRSLPTFLHLKDLGTPTQTWHWQWHAALAIEFLRQGSSADLTPSRAVLALTCAARNIDAAAKLLDSLDFTGDGVPALSCPIH